jgi:phosphoribosylglycinamide formyltransferase-1
MKKLRIACLASGRGSDFQSIVDAVERGEINGEIVVLGVDKPDAKAIERAEKHGIPWFCQSPKDYPERTEHDRAMRRELDKYSPDVVCLVGYLRIIKDPQWLNDYFGKMINIHPSLLPSFPGAHGQRDAFEAGAKVSGYTIHFVDKDPEALDGGPVIWQEAVDISDCQSADETADKILEREHVGLPRVVQSFAEGRYEIDGKRVRYIKGE